MSAVDGETTPLLLVEEIGGRGRALVSSQPLRGGQIVLRDSPILLYSALPCTNPATGSSSSAFYCDKCFRTITPAAAAAAVSCPLCAHHHFCSPSCLSTAATSSHSPWVCQSLTRLLQNCPPLLLHQERQVQARFLVAAYNLAALSPSDFQILLSLEGRVGEEEAVAAAQFLHPIVASLCPPPLPQGVPFSLQLTAALLSKDKANAFGLMEAGELGSGGIGQRSVRAYGIYPKASMFNHDCLPNACRFDYVDNVGDGNNTDIIVRMIHDVPRGREICLSYFPVNLNYSTRQKRLFEDYGFTCDCDRCKVEANWSDHEEDENAGGDEDGEDEVMEEDQYEGMEGLSGEEQDDNNGDNNDFPHAYFFARYMCSRENCWGTLAPLPPANDPSLSASELCWEILGSPVSAEIVVASRYTEA